MSNPKKPALKTLFENPYVTFVIGLGLGMIIIYNPYLLIGIVVIIAMVLFAFKDKIRIGDLFKGEPTYAPRETLSPQNTHSVKRLPCPECGSYTKHYKRCSHYGETVKK